MLALEHIAIQFGERRLFNDVSVVIGPHDRIGLVGSNGSGKSTLLKIISGLQQPDQGSIHKAQYVTVGYLPQDGITARGRTLYQEAETVFEDVLELQHELDDARQQLATLAPGTEEYSDTLGIIGELQHGIEDLDAYRMKSKIERVLMGLGFSMGDFNRMTEEFSGGWQMRIALAKLLLREPGILLLDEPTNHLDIESLQWLEEYLRQYNGAVMLVSHDRAFLDGLTTKTYALSLGKFEVFAGNYSFFERERIIRRELLKNRAKNQQQQIKETQQFIDRFRYKATKARQVQSRIKQLEKIERVEMENEESEIHFSFPQIQQSGRVVMELKHVSKSYGPVRVFTHLDYKIERGERIAVVGVNGAGKSTLAKILAGVEPFDAGERIQGHNVTLSYFAQDQAEELDPIKDVLQTVEEVASDETRSQLRTLLGSFLFWGDDVFKKVAVLSGGEKSRLALARMLLQPANFLIMDEPTNHLDMQSKQVLQDALKQYKGTMLIISHDRAFLDPFVTKVLETKPGSLKTYLGTVSEYLARKRAEREARASLEKSQGKANRQRTDWQMEQERRKALAKELRSIKRRMEDVEIDISRIEARKKELESMLSDADFYKDGDKATPALAEYKELQPKLDEYLSLWAQMAEKLEQANGEP
jgi:ATP-binding cassette subfamily F protein 3